MFPYYIHIWAFILIDNILQVWLGGTDSHYLPVQHKCYVMLIRVILSFSAAAAARYNLFCIFANVDYKSSLNMMLGPCSLMLEQAFCVDAQLKYFL